MQIEEVTSCSLTNWGPAPIWPCSRGNAGRKDGGRRGEEVKKEPHKGGKGGRKEDKAMEGGGEESESQPDG